MNQGKSVVPARAVLFTVFLAFASVLGIQAAQAPPAQGAPQAPPVGPARLDLTGATVTYRVQEQLAGINFPSDAVGTTDTVTGALALTADGAADSGQSKLSVDLGTFKSDQDLRDNYIRTRVFQVDKFPSADFVVRRVTGLANPLPITGQSGFQLIGDMTMHGVTKELTWNGIVTFTKDGAAGRAMTDFTFDTFGLMKPTLARLLSVGDKISLEVEFRAKRS